MDCLRGVEHEVCRVFIVKIKVPSNCEIEDKILFKLIFCKLRNFFFFFLCSGGWGKIKLQLTTQ